MKATRLAAETLRVLPRKRLSKMFGVAAAAHVPAAMLARAIDVYVRAYDVDLTECDVPPGGWPTFNAFFTRALRDGLRPIDDDPDILVSPADGRVEDSGPIDANAAFLVKGKRYEVGELLGDPADAARFEGGRFAIVYLSPRDYHRVHAAVEGEVHTVRHVGGTLFPVNRIGLEHIAGLFAKNERVAVFQTSPTHGEVATILVGAIVVGGIKLRFEPSLRTNAGPGRGTIRYVAGLRPFLRRGEELGRFELGSTVIVLTTKESAVEFSFEAGRSVKVGEALARAHHAESSANSRGA